jgi:hypothetical protein
MSSIGHLSEVESLRSQAANLTRALAERDQSMQAQSHHLEERMRDLREQSHLLRTNIEGTAAETGDEFFPSLVTHLTSTLHVQFAVIGEVLEGRFRKIRSLAVSAGGILVDNFEYELAHPPRATARHRPSYISTGVSGQRFLSPSVRQTSEPRAIALCRSGRKAKQSLDRSS